MWTYPYGVRELVSKAFHRFGIHCANHQIRVILISCVVITSLFYPALATYSTSKPVFHFSSRLLDYLLDPTGSTASTSTIKHLADLSEFWSNVDSLITPDNPLDLPRCSNHRKVRIERLLIHREPRTEFGSLAKDALLEAIYLQHNISHLLELQDEADPLRCLSDAQGNCVVLSPLALWNSSEEILNADLNILETIKRAPPLSISDIPLTLDMTLAARSSRHYSGSAVDFAYFLVLTYFFHEDDCVGKRQHNKWLNILDQLQSDSLRIRHGVQPATLMALAYDPSHSSSSDISMFSGFLYLAYIMFFIYFSGSLRRIDTVHSKWGLAFTGLIEIVVSTITSVSVCALVGFRVTLVPWGILPVVIVFVGAENMFILVDAVTSTPISLPVKERIGVGLSRAGTSNTLKVVTYNSIFGTIAVFAYGAVKEFCIFAIVVLVAHWFLIHTFFVAVLSIDIQRLELSELLSQDPSLQPSVPTSAKVPDKSGSSPPAGFVGSVTRILHGRPRRNISLLVMLAIMATLYYATLPSFFTPEQEAAKASLLRESSPPDLQSPAWKIWSLLNPENDELFHLRIESPSIVTFSSLGLHLNHRPYWLRLVVLALRPVFWTTKIVIIPIAGTTGLLYLVLLYLLKNKELLDARNHRHHEDPFQPIDLEPVEENIQLMSLPTSCEMDVDLLSCSADGIILASVSAIDEVGVWRLADLHYTPLKIKALSGIKCDDMSDTRSRSITAISVDPGGSFVSIGNMVGQIGFWRIDESLCEPCGIYKTAPYDVEVSSITFLSLDDMTSGPPTRIQASHSPIVLVCHTDGTAAEWKITPEPVMSLIKSSDAVETVRSLSVYSSNDPRTLLAFVLKDGAVKILERGDSAWDQKCRVQGGNPEDLVTQVQCLNAKIGGKYRSLLACVTDGGCISLWDGHSGECIHILENMHGRIDHLRLAEISSGICAKCGETQPESFAAIFSMGELLFEYQIILTSRDQGLMCSCLVLQSPLSPKANLPRSRSGSISSATGASPTVRTRSRIASNASSTSTENTFLFPVSGHGIHSRRSSELLNRRVSDGTSNCFEDEDDAESNPSFLGPRFADQSIPSPPSEDSIWAGVHCHRVTSIPLDRGVWDMSARQVIGIRRRARNTINGKSPPHTSNTSTSAVPASVLQRWEFWSFDPTKRDGMHLRASSLHDLADVTDRRSKNRDTINLELDSAGRSFPRLHFTRVLCFHAGSRVSAVGLGNSVVVLRTLFSR
ncbi:hypothetical protein SISSUDRAFT_996596 [Sistotremastrum suecicum HHB10207 ss-3]|uniref:Sterol regulatory element-binding protein cleavage-activating protein n=1 Tax=Sistotremastrum suecicum HHB10207 ss-3 TaxID=1314776 RepID=A0A166J043_9AGAM|nr:hypothetical protein SISSUDRAFT_996596 [Sistotremastrum suecicum HHB10207 ss-3]